MRALAPLFRAFAAWPRPRCCQRARALRPSVRFLAALAVLFAAVSASAEKRVALVIGNGAYQHAPALANPRNDAQAMAAALQRMKFEVVSGIDLDKPSMERLLRDFVQKLDNADLALVFYAGHGLQVHGRNYFVPVDAKLERETDLAFEAVSLELVQSVLEQARRTNILILDACRDNPLARNLARSMGTRSSGIGRGLGQTQAGIGTLIVYATQPGNVALDGDGAGNSPFTTALLKHIETPGLEIRLIVSRVRQAVIEATRDKQVPWDSSSLIGEVYLAAAQGTQPVAPPQAPPTAAPPIAAPVAPQPSAANEHLFWQTIKESKNPADFKAYLARWPNGTFSELAKIRIADLEKPVAVTPPPPPERPAPPPPPQRTTNYMNNTWIHGPIVNGRGATPSAQACAALCIRDPKCAGWMWWNEQHSNPQACHHYPQVTERSNTHPNSIAGVIRMTSAAPGQPGVAAQPQPPRRTSTIEPNTFLSGADVPGAPIRTGITPQICAASCVQHPQCTGWNLLHSTKGCILKSGALGKSPNNEWTTGVIRMTPGR